MGDRAAAGDVEADGDLLAVARRCVRALLAIEPHERVLVVTDAELAGLARVWAAAAAELAPAVTVMVAAPRERNGQEPEAGVAAAMRAADVILQPVTHALTHTDATRGALARGARVMVLRGITAAMMRRPFMNVDYDELRRVTTAVARTLSDARLVHVRTPAGTDLTFSTSGRSATALAGAIAPGRFGGPRTGEAAVAPLEGSAEGTVVLEHVVDDVGRLAAPVVLTLRSGVVVDIGGGADADALRRLVAAAGGCGSNLAEFAIGTNPAAELHGDVPEAKKVRGSAHVALGDSVSLGGTVRCELHVDGMLLAPTVHADGSVVVQDGQLAAALVDA